MNIPPISHTFVRFSAENDKKPDPGKKTTLALGEEGGRPGGPTTQALGEEGGTPDPNRKTTLMVGEEGGGI